MRDPTEKVLQFAEVRGGVASKPCACEVLDAVNLGLGEGRGPRPCVNENAEEDQARVGEEVALVRGDAKTYVAKCVSRC